MASKTKYGSAVQPSTYPNKPGGSAGKDAGYAGKHARAMDHVQPGMTKAATLSKKNRGQ